MKNFNKLGFEIEEFGRNFFRVTCCPHWLSSGRSITFIKDYLELACEQGNGMKTLEIVREAMIRDSLIKAGQGGEFSDQEMILLAKDLLACRNPFTCPKGSPTYFEIPHREFESRFRRKL